MRLATFSSLSQPRYRVYFAAMFFFFAAMQMTVLARPWLAYELSASGTGQRSALALGITVAANNLPMLLLSPHAGALADRFSKRLILHLSFLAMLAFALFTALGLMLEWFVWWHITLIGVAQGAAMTFILPTRRAMVADLVDKDHLLNAMALHTATQNFNRMIMPATGGIIIEWVGAQWAYVVIAGLYVVAMLTLLGVPSWAGATAGARRPMKGAVSEGFRYVMHEPTIRALLLINLVASVFAQPLQNLLPLFQDVYGIGAAQVGVMLTFFGAGSLLGSTTAASVGNFQRKGLLLIAFFLVLGGATVAFAFSPLYGLALVLLTPVGFGHSGRHAVHLAMLQYYAKPEMRGRVQALNVMQGGLMPIAVLVISAMADVVGTPWAVGSTGIAILAYTLWELLFAGRIRRLT